MDNEKKNRETEIFQQTLGDATHKPTENWEEEIAPEELNLINSETSGDITLGGEDHPPDGA